MRLRWLYAVVGSVILVLLGLLAWTSFHLLVHGTSSFGPLSLPPDREISLMSDADRDRLAARALSASAHQPDSTVEDPAPGDGKEPFIFAAGPFRPAPAGGRTGTGRAILYQLPDGRLLLRLTDFQVTPGPRLHILLSVNPAPDSYSDLAAGILDLGPLKGNAGNQNYPLPEKVTVSTYKSAVILSRPFHVIFASAFLE